MANITSTGLPPHDPISCRNCFSSTENVMEFGNWRVVNNPGAWGSAAPKILALGVSKGFAQATAYHRGFFDDVPFKDMRLRLSAMLTVLGVLRAGEDVRMVGRDFRGAVEGQQQALDLNPSFALAHMLMGSAHAYNGMAEEGLRHLAQATRVSPHDFNEAAIHSTVGLCHLMADAMPKRSNTSAEPCSSARNSRQRGEHLRRRQALPANWMSAGRPWRNLLPWSPIYRLPGSNGITRSFNRSTGHATPRN
jgi:hypothetical protein